MSETRQYELVYVVSPEVGEEGVSDLHTQVDGIITDLGGRIEKTENWGRRRLAYEIGKHKEGTYVIELIEGPGTVVSELDRKLKVLDIVLRHLVVRVDEDLKKAQRARELRQSRQQRRRAARGMPPLDEAPPASPGGESAPAAARRRRRGRSLTPAAPAAEAKSTTETASSDETAEVKQ